MALDRKNGAVPKEEPKLLWEDKDIAIILKGPGWIVAVSRERAQNLHLAGCLRASGIQDVKTLLESGKCEHLCHYIILKFKEDAGYELSDSIDHEFGIAHRLDVDTSGALMIAKTEKGFEHLRAAFTTHKVWKEYICLVHGAVKDSYGQITSPIAWDEYTNISYISDTGNWADTRYTVLGRYRLRGQSKIFTLCRIVIITGRTHQIRIHMASIDHPLVGDSKYNRRNVATDLMWCPRLFLHAWRVAFRDTSNHPQQVHAPLTKDLVKSLSRLEQVEVDVNNLGNPACRLVPPSRQYMGYREDSPAQTVDQRPEVVPEKPAPPQAGLFVPVAGGARVTDRPEPKLRPASAPPALAGASPWQPPKPPGGSFSEADAAVVTARAFVTLPTGAKLEVPGALPPPPPPPPKAAPIRPATPTTPPAEPPGKGEACAAPAAAKKAAAAAPPPPKAAAAALTTLEAARCEELLCDLAIKAILLHPKGRISLGVLGETEEMAALMQHMGPKKPKLTKLLRDRPETFEIFENSTMVCLTPRAMALARQEQVSYVKVATDASAAEATRQAVQAREKAAQKEELLRGGAAAQRRASPAPWAANSNYEANLVLLVDMGYDRQLALRVLRANNNDVAEAIDQLSGMPLDSRPPSLWTRHVAARGLAAPQPVDAQEHEDPLEKVLRLSRREADERRRREEAAEERELAAALAASKRQVAMTDEEVLAAALEASRRHTEDSAAPVAAPDEDGDVEGDGDGDEQQLQEALEESRRFDEDKQRREQLEQEELDRILRESVRDYELFNTSGDEEFQQTLRESLLHYEQQLQDASEEDELLQDAIQRSYNAAALSDEEEEEELLFRGHYPRPTAHGGGLCPIAEDWELNGHTYKASSASRWLEAGLAAVCAASASSSGGAASSSSSGCPPIGAAPPCEEGAEAATGGTEAAGAAVAGSSRRSRWSSSAAAAPSQAAVMAEHVVLDGNCGDAGGAQPEAPVAPPLEPQHPASAAASACSSASPGASTATFLAAAATSSPAPWAATAPCAGPSGPSSASSAGAPGAAPAAASGDQLRGWLIGRAAELRVAFDGQVLSEIFTEVPEDQLGDEEVLKMWLGLADGDELPRELKVLVCEYRQQRMMMRFSAA